MTYRKHRARMAAALAAGAWKADAIAGAFDSWARYYRDAEGARPPDACNVSAAGEWTRARVDVGMPNPYRERPSCRVCRSVIPLGRVAVLIRGRDPYARFLPTRRYDWVCRACAYAPWTGTGGAA